jgi:hypothetical protein
MLPATEQAADSGRRGVRERRAQNGWHAIPAWARTAAALLCLGTAAGIANLDVRYGAEGLRVRTGWTNVGEAPRPVPAALPERDAASRAELAALEERLRTELRETSSKLAAVSGSADLSPAALGRVRAIVDESERRQQRELALRLGEAMREVGVQRQADLARINRNIGAVETSTGREMLRQRSEMLNYLVRTAAQRPQ